MFAIATILYTLNANAHNRYIFPSHTVLSGEDTQYVTISASISNDIFHPDITLGDDGNRKVAEPLKEIFQGLNYFVIEPGGRTKQMVWHVFARYSFADIELKKKAPIKSRSNNPHC